MPIISSVFITVSTPICKNIFSTSRSFFAMVGRLQSRCLSVANRWSISCKAAVGCNSIVRVIVTLGHSNTARLPISQCHPTKKFRSSLLIFHLKEYHSKTLTLNDTFRSHSTRFLSSAAEIVHFLSDLILATTRFKSRCPSASSLSPVCVLIVTRLRRHCRQKFRRPLFQSIFLDAFGQSNFYHSR